MDRNAVADITRQDSDLGEGGVFGSKAETLARLGPKLRFSRVPPMTFFSVAAWKKDPAKCLEKIKDICQSGLVVVRSSGFEEDGFTNSLAGVHASVLDVDLSDTEHLIATVDHVIASYGPADDQADSANQVLVQKMVVNVNMSGVLFNRDLNTGAPYYVVNYDDLSGRTDTVTAGGEYSGRTLSIARSGVELVHSERFRKLILAVREIEAIVGDIGLDIEFSVAVDLSIDLLQVRPIAVKTSWKSRDTEALERRLDEIKSFLSTQFRPFPGLVGNNTVFGQMPDWNPAEMLGRVPRPLALSIYRYLITDRIWAEAREFMGYAPPKDMALMVDLGGLPFVDVRLVFNSFLPDGLDGRAGDALVSAWVNRLIERPHLHDKVEFDVAFTIVDADFASRFHQTYPGVLSAPEFDDWTNRLRSLSNDLLTGNKASIDEQLKLLDKFMEKHKPYEEALGTQQILGYLDECARYGTLPFAILARHGFIAETILRSLVRSGGMTARAADALRKSVHTVASELVDDLSHMAVDGSEKDRLMKRYGHLRPGTYDILSLRYDQHEEFFKPVEKVTQDQVIGPDFSPDAEMLQKVAALFDQCGLEIGPENFFAYYRKATAARELAKFRFTRHLSNALEAIAAHGKNVGLDRECLSFLEFQDFCRLTRSTAGSNHRDKLIDLSERAREAHKISAAIQLPMLVHDLDAPYVIPYQVDSPNFVTNGKVHAPVIFLSSRGDELPSLAGKAVLIERADPGFDWIFSFGIAALCTKYGGSNSHMAIRCAEFGIPAAIGCGEQIFERIKAASMIDLDCAAGSIVPVK